MSHRTKVIISFTSASIFMALLLVGVLWEPLVILGLKVLVTSALTGVATLMCLGMGEK